MNLIYVLITLVIFVFIIFLLIKIVKKIVFTIVLVLLIVCLVFGYLVFADIRDIEHNFANSTKLILFEQGGNIVQGFKARGFGLLEKDFLTQEKLLSEQQNYEKRDYKQMLEDNYKILIFKKELFGDVGTEELPAAYDEKLEDQGPAFIYREFKEGNVEVYPETPFFKALKRIPDFIAEKLRMLE